MGLFRHCDAKEVPRVAATSSVIDGMIRVGKDVMF